MKLHSVAVRAVVAALVLYTPALWAQDGLEGALSRTSASSATNFSNLWAQPLAAADFDGDNRPDGAVLIDYGWLQPHGSSHKIELHFTGRRNAELTFETTERALTVSAIDVNRDGATDIVVEQPLTHKRLLVWLNNGRGDFHRVRTEDFPAATDMGFGQQAAGPGSMPDCPALSLQLQPGFESAVLAASFLRGRPPSAERCEASSFGISPLSSFRSAGSSRAPPRFFS